MNFDQVRVTNEAGVSQPIGVDSTAESAKPASGKLGATPAEPETVAASDGTFVERKLEQIVSAPGSIKKLSVGIVVDGELPPATLNQLRAIASAAVGATATRGDAVVVFSRQASTEPPPIAALALMTLPNKAAPSANAKVGSRQVEGSRKEAMATSSKSATTETSSPNAAPDSPAPDQAAAAPENDSESTPAAPTATSSGIEQQPSWPVLAYGVVALLVGSVALALLRRSRRAPSPVRPLSSAERDEYVLRLRTMLADVRGHHGS